MILSLEPKGAALRESAAFLLLTTTDSWPLSPLYHVCVSGSVPVVYMWEQGCPYIGTAAAALVGCSCVNTAPEGATLLSESKFECFAALSACLGSGAAQMSLELRSESGGELLEDMFCSHYVLTAAIKVPSALRWAHQGPGGLSDLAEATQLGFQ